MSTDAPSALTQFDRQAAYTLGGAAAREGSVAIANGRCAGLAIEAGLTQVATHFWSQVPALSDMPTWEAFREGYHAHRADFSAFADATHFPAGGTPLSNALGSYAYALDYLVRGDTALAGGNAQDTCRWGAAVLRAAGFPEKAEAVEKAWEQKIPPAQIAANAATSTGTAVPQAETALTP